MKCSIVRRVLTLAVAGAITTGMAAGATAKTHKVTKVAKYAVAVAAGSYARASVQPAAASTKICYRYYGGPKGGMWPGACPQ